LQTIGLGKTIEAARRGGVGKLGMEFQRLRKIGTEVTSVSFDHRFNNLKANITKK
jgi:hypothetical protein